jgi:hypothetical protein
MIVLEVFIFYGDKILYFIKIFLQCKHWVFPSFGKFLKKYFSDNKNGKLE